MLRATSGWDRKPLEVGECDYDWPPPERWREHDDLIGRGADLNVATIVDGYRHGLFAMESFDGDGSLLWWSPEQRFAFDSFDVQTSDGGVARLRLDHMRRCWQIDAVYD